MNEIRIRLQPKQLLFLKSVQNTPVVLYGGARGGGKSKGLRDIMLVRRFQYPGSDGAIFRRSYPELEGNHIRPLFKDFPDLRPYYNDSKKILTLPNGSTLQFCHCESEKEVTLYQGREFQDLGIEEAGQWSESMFQTLRGSNRSSKPGIPARTLLTANPGGVGHTWLKRIFIERQFNDRERADDYAFIQALVDDNPALLENDPDYVYRLEAEPNEALRRAYRHGDWDIFAGQFFSEVRREVHFIKAFDPPPHWNRFGSYDYGFNHPTAFGWFASDEDGNVYLYREFIKAGLRVDQVAQHLLSFEDTLKLYPIVAGHDSFATKVALNQSQPPTIADEFKKFKIYLKKANIDRIQGAAQVRAYLAWQNLASGRAKPRFYIMDTCPISFECLTRMQTDQNRFEDVMKVDSINGDPHTGDDPYDMIRYALMSKPRLSESIAKPKFGTKEYDQKIHEEMFQFTVDRLKAERDIYTQGFEDW